MRTLLRPWGRLRELCHPLYSNSVSASSPRPGPEQIIATYERIAERFAAERDQSLIERPWLDLALQGLERPQVLDLGCGPGAPIARYLSDAGAELTGVDAAAGMIELFRAELPQAQAHVADMRGLDLGRQFDVVVAWNSFFHLSRSDQADMFAVFARHCQSYGRLLWTSGPEESEVWGIAGGAPVYHASASPESYRAWLAAAGFSVLRHVERDESCGGLTVWLAQRDPVSGGSGLLSSP